MFSRISPPLLTIAAVVLAVTGCADSRVVLWTDRADAAPAVEMFNHEQDRYVVELRYDTDVASALRRESTDADVVIAAAIEDQDTAGMFLSLERLIEGTLERDAFYQELLANGARSGRQRLLPLSFNLPLVFFRTETVTGDTISLAPDDIRSASDTFNVIDEETAGQLAFSPMWNRAFLYELVRHFGFEALEGEDGEPVWELSDLLAGLSYATGWIENENGGQQVDAAFREQYLYDPVIRLVQEGRIQFGFDNSENYLRRSDESRRGLSFRWFGGPDKIRATESVVYAGVHESASNRAGAFAFLEWLFMEETQARILEENRRKRIDSFALVGGFSSLWRVTERVIPTEYPQLASLIPPASWLDFPGPLPRYWPAAVESVVQPWLMQEVSGQSQARDLTSTMRAWLLQQGE